MPARIRAPTSRTLAPAPSRRIKRRRRPDGSVKTGAASCRPAPLDGGIPCDWVTRRVYESRGMAAAQHQNSAYQYITCIRTLVAAPDKEGPATVVGEPGRPHELM
jgi:hypothetical protein